MPKYTILSEHIQSLRDAGGKLEGAVIYEVELQTDSGYTEMQSYGVLDLEDRDKILMDALDHFVSSYAKMQNP